MIACVFEFIDKHGHELPATIHNLTDISPGF
jgi:hypothetical protein